jgi:hypothetical protein
MKRRPEFTASVASEDFIARMNDVIALGEDNVDIVPQRQRPILMVVGAPRSGTTVLMQWFRSTGFATPSNIAARFPRNPYFAGMLQRLLTDPALNFRDELTIPESDPFRSDYGKTKGPLSPHEFSFYFRRFFPVTVGEPVAPDAPCDVAGFIDGLQVFAAAMGRPVVLKGLLVQYMLDRFMDAAPVFFLHVHRDEADNVRSLYRHRRQVADDPEEWISVRPPQYAWLKDMSPVEQVAGQVHFTNLEVRRQLAALPQGRVLSVSHDDFCADPGGLNARLSAAFEAGGFDPLPVPEDVAPFEVTRYDPNDPDRKAAEAALVQVSRGNP